MVTVPVNVPFANDEVFSAICTGVQEAPRLQGCCAPRFAVSQVTEEEVCRLSAPSPTLAVSKVCVGPFAPAATETENAVCVSASRGAALRIALGARMRSSKPQLFLRITSSAPFGTFQFRIGQRKTPTEKRGVAMEGGREDANPIAVCRPLSQVMNSMRGP